MPSSAPLTRPTNANSNVAINTVATAYDLGFLPLQEERYDFVVPKARMERPAVKAFRAALEDPGTRAELRAAGFLVA